MKIKLYCIGVLAKCKANIFLFIELRDFLIFFFAKFWGEGREVRRDINKFEDKLETFFLTRLFYLTINS